MLQYFSDLSIGLYWSIAPQINLLVVSKDTIQRQLMVTDYKLHRVASQGGKPVVRFGKSMESSRLYSSTRLRRIGVLDMI